MHTSIFLTVLAATSLAAAAPQGTSLNDLPVCAQQAGLAAIDATGCSLGDISCICNSVPFISTLRSYIEAHCSASDQAAALEYGQSTCAPYGVTFSATVPGVSATATATPAAIESDVAPPPTTTMASAGTVTSTINPTDAAMGVSVSVSGSASWTASWPIPAPTGNSTATLLPYTGAAANSFIYEIAMVLAGAAGVAAFLI